MCTLIYVVVPGRSGVAAVSGAAISLHPVRDPHLTPKLTTHEQLCVPAGVPQCAAGGYCGTVLGRMVGPSGRSDEERDAARAKKLRRNGWSEHKVQAWLHQKQMSRAAQSPNLNGDVDELALWQDLLHVALDQYRLEHLGLMVFTAGDEPNLPIAERAVSREACDLSLLQSGVLYRIHASRQGG